MASTFPLQSLDGYTLSTCNGHVFTYKLFICRQQWFTLEVGQVAKEQDKGYRVQAGVGVAQAPGGH